ncbi:hypothetical protein POX_f07597 [Penicillium oxalicum]|uniref:hypothetical protein n=1 Tax=Penicillium oxalicum TaxID=69781 RepID=UPI0020B83A16|nr:hypothetical protein POX_f07597 [Penicillium oxalicum]KAI2787234.1 hypothetical protein POX_f07597 [Penicillium oxalicum]
MFYSHEMLSSPEHGVATIWLVATLGSHSLTRRLNRKAIQEVDVPEACNMILNPDAPIALRLQGNLLYGLSKVYDQQCGYTLLDAQTMRDKMISMLKQLPGGGLDPSAGKTKAANLILPYDQSFIPETGLPGLDINFHFLEGVASQASSQLFDGWANSLGTLFSGDSQLGVIHLDINEDDLIGTEDVNAINTDAVSSGKKRGLFGKRTRSDLEDEGVLLQPDFEFDEEGNLVELNEDGLSPRKRRKTDMQGEAMEALTDELVEQGNLRMDTNEDILLPAPVEEQVTQPLPVQQNTESTLRSSVEMRMLEDGEIERAAETRARQRIRRAKVISSDNSTTLRNTDLARWNDEYAANMAQVLKQKNQNKLASLSKKNAEFWVFGLGIGSVGLGLGQHREEGPLNHYSGDALHGLISGETTFARLGNRDSTEKQESPRSRGQAVRSGSPDVEIARNAPSSAYYDRSSEMPWNITASLPSSIRGQKFSSISESSARPRGRLTSASPLAGRSYPDGRERQSSLSILNAGDELDKLEQLDITRYLESELAPDREDISTISLRRKSTSERIVSTLDAESLNFLDFIQLKLEEHSTNSSSRIAFSWLLPPATTARNVAAQGFLNVLTLATKGALNVSQEACNGSGASSRSLSAHHGDISLQLAVTPV